MVPNLNQSLFQLTCGACGAIGHMRTNKECPSYSSKGEGGGGGGSGGGGGGGGGNGSGNGSMLSTPVAMTLEQEHKEEEAGKALAAQKDIINVEGTKVKISKSLIKQ